MKQATIMPVPWTREKPDFLADLSKNPPAPPISEEERKARDNFPLHSSLEEITRGDPTDPLGSLQKWLYTWLMNGGKLTDDQKDAYMAQLLQLQQSELQYKRSLPEEQIQHLMATGMSRAQAISMLQGSTYTPSSMPVAGNVEQAQQDRINTILNGVSSGVQLLGQLVEMGMQLGMAPAVIKQTYQAQQIHNLNLQMLQGQQQATMDTGAMLQAMYNWQQTTGAEYPSSLKDMVTEMQSVDPVTMPDVYATANKYGEMLKNPSFYPMLKNAYKRIYMDKNDLYNEMVRDNASANIQQLDWNKALEELRIIRSQANVQEQTEQDQIDISGSMVTINASQASMAHNAADIDNIDHDFWTQFDGKQRFSYLHDMSEQQAYSTALAKLNVKNQEYVNAMVYHEMTEKLEIAKRLGDDYFDACAGVMMKNTTYRNAVLQLGNLQAENALSYRIFSDVVANNIPPFGALRDLSDYFKSTGVLDKAITIGAQLAGFFAK